MVPLPVSNRAVLELVHYEDGIASYESPALLTLGGHDLPGVHLDLPRDQWDALGRPASVVITYTVEVQ